VLGRLVIATVAGIAGMACVTGCSSHSGNAHAPVTTPAAAASASLRSAAASPLASSVSASSAAPLASAARAAPAASAAPVFSAAPVVSATSPPATAIPGEALPISVQSDEQMAAAGNPGPSSTILLPLSCVLSGHTVTATGSYSNNGFVPADYGRYGDVIDLYVFTAPAHGYAYGFQIAMLPIDKAPTVGGSARWQVSESVDLSLGQPARCMVAAQPTHDFEGAPNAY
jgi:hypothetical protein